MASALYKVEERLVRFVSYDIERTPHDVQRALSFEAIDERAAIVKYLRKRAEWWRVFDRNKPNSGRSSVLDEAADLIELLAHIGSGEPNPA